MVSLKTKLLYQLSASLLHTLLPIVTFPYVTRVLGPDKLGAINFVDYTAQIFITLANFGIPLYAVREIAKVRETSNQLQKVVSELLSIHLITTFIGVIGFLITMYYSWSEDYGYSLILLASFNIFFSAFSLNWFIHGLEDFKVLSIRSLAIKVIVVALVFLFIQKTDDYNKYYFILVAGSLMLIFYDIYYLITKGISFAFSKSIKKHFQPLFIFFLTSASVSLYTLFDTFILGVLTTTLAVGLYTTALKIIRLFQSFVNSLGGVLLPRIAYLIEQKQEKEISGILNKSLLYVFTIAIPAGFLFFLLAPEIIAVLAGKQYIESIPALQILSPLPLLIGLSNVFGIQVLIPFGKEKQLLISVVAGSIISIAFCVILIPIYQQSGAALATLITELLVTLLMGIYAIGKIQMKFPLKSLFTIGLSAVIFIPIVSAVRYFFSEDILILSASLITCMIVFIISQLYIFSNSVILEMLHYFNTFFSKLKYSK